VEPGRGDKGAGPARRPPGAAAARPHAARRTRSALARNLCPRRPRDLFGRRGRRWLDGMKLPEDERLSVSACLRQVDFLDEVPALERALAERALRSPAIRRLMTVPGREREHCGGVHAVGRAASGASIHCASRRLSRPRPARSPVGLLGGPTRPHLEGRLLRGPPHARRGGLVGGDADRTDARLLRAHPGAAVPGRGDRHGGTSCAPLFWHLLTRRRTRPSRGRRSRARSGGSSSCAPAGSPSAASNADHPLRRRDLHERER